MPGAYPNTIYRVAVKALIKNDKGQLLLVKENSDKWDLPGGGLDHGEEPEDGIRREIHEEIGVSSGVQVGKLLKQKSFYFSNRQVWLLWNIYEVTLPSDAQFLLGEGVSAIKFIDPESFSASEDERERYLTVLGKLF